MQKNDCIKYLISDLTFYMIVLVARLSRLISSWLLIAFLFSICLDCCKNHLPLVSIVSSSTIYHCTWIDSLPVCFTCVQGKVAREPHKRWHQLELEHCDQSGIWSGSLVDLK